MNRSFKKLSTLLGAGVVALAAAAPAHAVLIASEAFDYAPGSYSSVAPPPGPGDFPGLSGGIGWSTPFRSHFGAGQTIEIGSGPTGGFFDGTAVAANNFTRDRIMSSNTSTADGTVTWQVMYLSTDGGTGGGFQVNNPNGGRDYQVSIDGSGNYQFFGGHGGDTVQNNLGIAASSSISAPDVLLFKTEVLPGSQMTTSLWIAPNLGAGEGGLGAAVSSVTYNAFAGNKSIGQINLNPNGTVRVDDIHFGTEFGDVVSALTALPPPPPAGDKVGWNFVMRNGSQLAPAESAGFTGFEQTNWNNDGPNGQGSSGGISNLMDNNGLPTAVAVSWTGSGNSWNLDGPLATPDGKLNDGFLNQRPSVTVTGLSEEFGEDGYSLIVYYNNNEGPGTSDVTVAGILDDLIVQRMITGPTGSTRFEENGYLLEEGLLAGATNVMIFEGLNDLGFVLSFATVTGNGNNGITAFQIVKNFVPSIPEPTTAMLLSFATCGLALVRRSRREASVNA